MLDGSINLKVNHSWIPTMGSSRYLPSTRQALIQLVRHEPLGVCVGITSFNVPLLLLAAKCAPALATGNTFIVKPSERNCLSTMYLGKLFKEAGFPPGVFNCVIGEGNTGRLLSEHPDVNKVPPINQAPC